MINICFNDEFIQIPDRHSLMLLLKEKNCNVDYCAVSLNRQFIPGLQHEMTILQENDVVEIIVPMQGG